MGGGGCKGSLLLIRILGAVLMHLTCILIRIKENINQATKYGRAAYLNQNLRRRSVIQLAGFRLWNLPIRTITDRGVLARHRRICQRCPAQVVDDEAHFLFDCQRTQPARVVYRHFFTTRSLPEFLNQSHKQIVGCIRMLICCIQDMEQ